jgi:hypothetical protein
MLKQFFEELLAEAQKIANKSYVTDSMGQGEEANMVKCLKLLIASCDAKYPSETAIKSAWQTVARVGRKHGLFEKYQGNEELRAVLKSFLGSE